MGLKRGQKFTIYLDDEEAKRIRLYSGLLPLKHSAQEVLREQLMKMVDAYLANVKVEYLPEEK